MNRPIFNSCFAKEINNYLDYKVACGYQIKSYSYILRDFDNFCINHKIKAMNFTRKDADAWCKKRMSESNTTHYARVNKTKAFINYLNLKGYSVFPLKDVKFKVTNFQPHIYTDNETIRYFKAVDEYISRSNRMEAIQLPVLFRLLYCCGTRINESLGIRKCDVDLNNGIIKLNETKNNYERYIVLNKELKSLLFQYANKCFYLFGDNDFIFPSLTKTRSTESHLYDVHRRILKQASIPYIGGGHGPRIHDWRHTFAVKSFKKMIDQGLDMYVALPILSTYLGHKTIYATERYIRLTVSIYPYLEEKCAEKIKKIFDKEVFNNETN